MAEENKNSIFTQEEMDKLNETQQYRDMMVKNMFRDGKIPEGPRDIEVVNAVLTSIDKSIMDQANIRLKQQDNMNKEATLEIVSDMIKAIHKQKVSTTDANRVIELEDKLIPTDIVEGETDTVPVAVTLDDILKGGE